MEQAFLQSSNHEGIFHLGSACCCGELRLFSPSYDAFGPQPACLRSVSTQPGAQRNARAVYFRGQTKRDTQSRQQKIANPLNDLLDEAQRDIDANSFDAALAPLQKFIAEKPEVAFAHFQLAYAYTALKRGDDARAEYERAIALDAKMPEAYLNLGILLAG